MKTIELDITTGEMTLKVLEPDGVETSTYADAGDTLTITFTEPTVILVRRAP